jgi:hypothetical protein
MKKKVTIAAVLVVLAVLLFSQNTDASPQNKIESWDFYAAKQTDCYLAEINEKSLWLVKFDQKLKPFKANEFVSNDWLGETTYTNAQGVRNTFYFFEIEAGGVVFPVAVLSTDLNRVIA